MADDFVAPSTSIPTAQELHRRLAGATMPAGIARLYSLRTLVKAGRPRFASWNEVEANVRTQQAFRLIEVALVEKRGGVDGWEAALRRAGEILEWLADAEPERDERVRLLSAAAYQIAGYPARSRGQLQEIADLSMISHFFCADFPSLYTELPNLWQSLLGEGDRAIENVLPLEISRALGIISAFIRWGDESRLESALEKLKDASVAMLYGVDTTEWLLAKLCGLVAETFIENDLRRNVSALADTLTEAGRLAIEHYVRQAYLSRRSLVWPSQAAGIRAILSSRNFALCTPTGSGKTSVAELAILKALFDSSIVQSPLDGPIALYVVPTRALANEVERRLAQTVARLGTDTEITVTGLYGGTDWGPTDAWVTNQGPMILICTYEKAEALLRFIGPLFERRVRLVVVDEAHGVNFTRGRSEAGNEGNRPLRLESLLMRLLTRFRDDLVRFIALSAVAQGSEEAISTWVAGASEQQPVKVPYRSMRQMVGRLLCGPSGFRIEYDLLDGVDLRLGAQTNQEDRPYIPTPVPAYPFKAETTAKTNELWVRPYLFWAALHMAARNSAGQQGTVLISVTQNPGAYAENLLGLLDGDWRRHPLPDFFFEPTDNEQIELWRACLDSCADYFGKLSREYRLLERGIVVHHGKMPGLMARLLIRVIEAGIVHVVIATSTLTEGVNLPFDTILIPKLERYGDGPMPAQEFANLIGRAGRPGKSVEGRGLVVFYSEQTIPSTVRSDVVIMMRQYEAILNQLKQQGSGASEQVNAVSPLAELLEHLKECWDELQPSGSIADFHAWLEATSVSQEVAQSKALSALDTLDGVLLPVIVEVESDIEIQDSAVTSTDLEEALKNFWRQSYAYVASARQEELQRCFTKRGVALHEKHITDKSERRRLYRSSLSPSNGRILMNAFSSLRETLMGGNDYAVWGKRERLAYIISVLEAVAKVPTFAPKANKFKGGWEAVLTWWLSPDVAKEKPTPAKITVWQQYASVNFAYRGAWGIGSVLALIADEAHAGQLRETSFDDWENIGLPWAAMWLKEMMIWGTLEPVAAYLLTRGYSGTRNAAESQADRYYSQQSSSITDDPNSLLHPTRIKNWADAEFAVVTAARRRIRRSFPANLSRDFSQQAKRQWRVHPSVQDNEVFWFDPAGYLLATSRRVSSEEISSSGEYDYILDADKSTVTAELFMPSLR